MIGIIGAMDVEVCALKNKIEDKRVSAFAGIEFECGTIEGAPVCVAQCSSGKVNAAMCAQIMIDKFDVESVINIGVGCSLSKDVVIKNVVIATDVCEYDIDITALGEEKGFINGLGTVKIATDKALSDELVKCAAECSATVRRGSIATGDAFIADSALKRELSEDFGAICGEMEGGAIGHICAANKVPFAVVRSISDGGNEDSQLDYPAFKMVAAEISSSILLRFLNNRK